MVITGLASGHDRQMSKLPERTRAICIDIMEKLMQLPCAKPFLNPVDAEQDETANYYNVIKHPIDLNQIYKRLTNNEYTGISQWDKDMNFVWNNAEKFFNKTSMTGILAAELHRHYDKEYQRVKILRLAKWSRVVFSFRTKLESLFENVPPVIGALAQLSSEGPMKPFSEEELNQFIRMSLYLQNPLDSKQMAQIVQHYQPDCKIGKGNVEIDVNDMDVQTLHALRDFVTFRLAEMNIAYPR